MFLIYLIILIILECVISALSSYFSFDSDKISDIVAPPLGIMALLFNLCIGYIPGLGVWEKINNVLNALFLIICCILFYIMKDKWQQFYDDL